jgi:hypothetical protein
MLLYYRLEHYLSLLTNVQLFNDLLSSTLVAIVVTLDRM